MVQPCDPRWHLRCPRAPKTKGKKSMISSIGRAGAGIQLTLNSDSQKTSPNDPTLGVWQAPSLLKVTGMLRCPKTSQHEKNTLPNSVDRLNTSNKKCCPINDVSLLKFVGNRTDLSLRDPTPCFDHTRAWKTDPESESWKVLAQMECPYEMEVP